MPTVNILKDCSCTMTFSASDAGGGETFASSTSFKADSVAIDVSRDAPDHSTGQDSHEQPRLKKVSGSTTIRTKLYEANLLTRCQANELGKLVVTAPTGYGATVEGIITKCSPTYDIPSEYEIVIKHRIPVVYA